MASRILTFPTAIVCPETHGRRRDLLSGFGHPPFAGSLDYEATAKDLAADRQNHRRRAALPRPFSAALEDPAARRRHRAGKVFVWFQQGAPGDCGACGGGSQARRRGETPLRRIRPGPYRASSTAILLFTRLASRHRHVWFLYLKLRAIRSTTNAQLFCLREAAFATQALSEEEHAKNNLPDVLRRGKRNGAERSAHAGREFLCAEGRKLPPPAL